MSSAFAALGVSSDIVELLNSQGIEQPFPIQEATIAEALTGRDVCAKAPTGSGKTLAFAIPLVTRIERARPKCPRALILVPTRELCMQVAEVLRPIAKTKGLRVAEVYGGAGYGDQAKQIRRGCDIVVACAGRLGDLMQRGDLMLKDVGVVVLDEADRMADMGFLPEVKKLLGHIVVKHQMLLFSATLDGPVNKFVKDYLEDPFRFETAPSKEKSNAVHLFWETSRNERPKVLAEIAEKSSSTIVFCRTKRGVDRLVTQLKDLGVKSVPIHGDRSQAQRTRALASFTDGYAKTMVATDVAARGLHIDDVDCVVHFDQPDDYTDYVHRSGRTARAGATGTVISLVIPEQRKIARNVQIKAKLNVKTGQVNWDDVAQLGDKVIERKPRAPRPEREERDRRPSRGRPNRDRNRSGRSDRSNKSGRSNRYNREVRPARDRNEGNERNERTERSDRSGRPQRSGKPQSRYGRSERDDSRREGGGTRRSGNSARSNSSSRGYGKPNERSNGNRNSSEGRTAEGNSKSGKPYARKGKPVGKRTGESRFSRKKTTTGHGKSSEGRSTSRFKRTFSGNKKRAATRD